MLLRRTALCTLSISWLLGLPARVVRSEPSRDRMTAEVLADEAAKLMSRGDYAAGCNKYEDSERLDPSPERLVTLANCRERQGKTASAWLALGEASEMAERRGYSRVAEEARRNKKRLDPHLGRLNIVVADDAAGIAGLEISRDGSVVARAAWGLGIPVDPGSHVISATAPGRQRWSAEVGLAPGPSTVSVRVPALAVDNALFERRDGSPLPTIPARAPAPPPENQAASDDSTGRSQRTVGLVLGATGVAGLAVGAVFAVAARSTHDEIQEQCVADLCPPSTLALRDSWRAQANIANVALGLGVASLAGGAIVYFSAPSAARTQRARQLGIAPVVGLGSAGLFATGEF